MMFDFALLWELLPIFGSAALRTIALTAAGVVGGMVIGFLANMLRDTGWRAWQLWYLGYVAVCRGTPFLIHLFIAYFGLPAIGIQLDPFTAAAGALAIYSGAYFGEIFRACWQAIPRGQIEAARTMGLNSRQVFWHIVCPQALRASVPLQINQIILTLKESALASVITYPELTLAAGKIVSEQFVYLEPYLLLAVSYWLLATCIELLGSVLRKRVAPVGGKP